MNHLLITLALLLCAAPTLAQTEPAPPPAPVAVPEAVPAPPAPPPPAPPPRIYATTRVVMQTSNGPITLTLERERAPLTTANFLKYVDQKRFDGIDFYRAYNIANAPGLGLVQAGIRGNSKLVLPPIAHEPTSKTGLTHDDGAISMARGAPGSAAGDFFIIIGALTALDADPKAGGDNQGYAVFGHVVSGMDVIKHILAAPTSPTAGSGAMKGQMIVAPIRITSVRRIK